MQVEVETPRLGALCSEHITLDNGLFEKPTLSVASSARSSASASSAGSRPSAGPSLASSNKSRTEIGTFLDRLFPTGDFLDGLAAGDSRDGSQRASFYKRQPLGAATVSATNSRATPQPKRTPQSPSWMAKRGGGGEAPKARERLLPSSSNAITGESNEDRTASAVQLREDLKAKSSKDALSAAEERKRRIKERQAEQAAFENSMKSDAQVKAEAAAAAALEARQQRIREKAAAAAGSGSTAGGGKAGGSGGSASHRDVPLTEEEAEALREREALRLEKKQAMLQQEAEAAEKAKATAAKRAEQTEAKKREQESAAARKENAIKERAEARQRQNEDKAARLKKFQEEKLQQQKAKQQKQAQKQAAPKAGSAAAIHNAWWCDVALEGCLRPCEGTYAPCCRWSHDEEGTYVACEACFNDHLTADQQEALMLVEPMR